MNRNSNLDLLRAIAIIMVVAYHVLQMSPQPLSVVMKFARYGQYGVELFFVLSGWLIGGLYWNEKACFGDVGLCRFWLRRCLRTIPPYLAALVLSWLAVFIHGGKAFDFGYIIFIQNYYDQIPYFLVSWSLCIEEHFYLFLPLLLAFKFQGDKTITVLFSILVLVAPTWRWLISLNGFAPAFGYGQTATHLRMEGLLIGFWLAHYRVCSPQWWNKLKQISPQVLVVASAFFVALQFASPVWMYRLGLTLLVIGLAALLVWLFDRKVGRFISSPWVKGIAQASFSIYLTHPLMIHAARKLLEKFPSLPKLLYFPTVLCFIVMASVIFYFCVERTSILLRDRWVPKRGTALV